MTRNAEATMTTVSAPPQPRIVLNVTWDGYVRIGEVLRDQPVRMTYHRGRLEIMTLSHAHEWLKKLIARLLELLTLELNVEVHSGGSTTFRDEEVDAGMEPDECYWIEHAEQMRGKASFDPGSDPSPDLALEIEVSRTVLNRLAVYAGLGIPEVWRCDGQAIRVLLLQPNGEYQTSPTSKAFPAVPVGELARFLDMRHSQGETQILRQFQEWVRQQVTEWGTKKPRGRKK
jgi:Uma2 family endonuclease